MTTSSMSTPTTTTNDTVIGGVDTHADAHVAAAITSTGGVLGTQSLPTTVAGYRQPLAWLQSFGSLDRVGVEGTGSYGAALARHLTEQSVTVVEVGRAQPPAPPSPGQDRCCRCHRCRASWALR